MADLNQSAPITARDGNSPDLSDARSAMPTISRIDKLRYDIALPFGIRGSSSQYALDPFTERNARADGVSTEFPIYQVNPNYDMSSREWISMVHATVYAAAARAVSHCGHILWNGTEHPPNKMPILMVFAGPRPDLIGQPAPTPVEAFLEESQLSRGTPPTPYRERTGRASYQESSLHGKILPTFNEGGLSCAHRNGHWQVIDPKLIHIQMTSEEHFAICAALDKQLAWSGLTLFELARVSREPGRQDECWEIARKSANQISWGHAQETTAAMPAEYLYSQAVGHFFTNRLVKETLALLRDARQFISKP